MTPHIELPVTQAKAWPQRFFYRKESLKTTWTFRLSVVGGLVLLVSLTRGFWVQGIGRSLICAEDVTAADAILIDNLEGNYQLFERATALFKEGRAPRVLVPVTMSSDGETPNEVAKGIAEVMIHAAHLPKWEIVPVRITEPVSLNAAYQVEDFFARQNIQSAIVVTPGFRSRRSLLVYRAALGPGVTLSCAPVVSEMSSATWTRTWHGIEDVTLQFLKLQYYQLYVLPHAALFRREINGPANQNESALP